MYMFTSVSQKDVDEIYHNSPDIFTVCHSMYTEKESGYRIRFFGMELIPSRV